MNPTPKRRGREPGTKLTEAHKLKIAQGVSRAQCYKTPGSAERAQVAAVLDPRSLLARLDAGFTPEQIGRLVCKAIRKHESHLRPPVAP